MSLKETLKKALNFSPLQSYVSETIPTVSLPLPLRSNSQKDSTKRGAPKNFAKFTGKYRARVSFLKKRLCHRCLLENFVEYFRTSFLKTTFRRLLLATGESCDRCTAQKMFVFGVFLARTLLHSDQKNSEFGHFSHSSWLSENRLAGVGVNINGQIARKSPIYIYKGNLGTLHDSIFFYDYLLPNESACWFCQNRRNMFFSHGV